MAGCMLLLAPASNGCSTRRSQELELLGGGRCPGIHSLSLKAETAWTPRRLRSAAPPESVLNEVRCVLAAALGGEQSSRPCHTHATPPARDRGKSY
jgi:hypothetical protein